MRNLLVCVAALSAPPALAQQLSPQEQRIRDAVVAGYDEAVNLLARSVNVASGTFNLAGVRAVGALYQKEFEALGFSTRWIDLPPALGRAGHLIAEWRGRRATAATQRLLLIGHLDTVFEAAGRPFSRQDTVGYGPGAADMKGGNAAVLLALRALKDAGALDDLVLTAVFTGDEEAAGRPLSVARKDLIEAARRSDVALAFEGGDARTATVSRRSASGWVLTVTGRQAHSSGIFRDGVGYGAVFEAARILNEFRERLAKQPYLTFNPGTIVGGTEVRYDSGAVRGDAAGKTNIVARRVVAQGDLRTLTDGQLDSARATMRLIVSSSLPGTSATISFDQGYPSMPPTDGNRAILAVFDRVSQDLGYPAIEALPPDRRGAGDISFVADILPSLDGLGVDGFGAHAPEEGIYLPSLKMAAERAAILMTRLARSRRPATSDR
ncbi:MAG: M20 family metallopeptidase [Gemmatimonadetes bacterium]|nr:M20 family metallopeptidase [Gemmatimonadota bacterium]